MARNARIYQAEAVVGVSSFPRLASEGEAKTSMRKLFIDLGHSAPFPGAFGVRSEVEWNRAIWKELKPLIDGKKWSIVEVPPSFGKSDKNANSQLVNRINFINRNGGPADFLLSIHGNAASNKNVRGVTTCFMGGSESAKREAAKLSKIVSQATGMPVWNGGSFDDRNARYGRIGMVRDTEPFALLIEAGFVTSPVDMKVSPKAVAQGIAKYYNSFPL